MNQRKAYDRVEHNYLFMILREYKIPDTVITAHQTAYSGNGIRVRMASMIGEPFNYSEEFDKGAPSPHPFIIATDLYLRAVKQNTLFQGIPFPGSCCLEVLTYGDDVVLYARDKRYVKEGLKYLQAIRNALLQN